jgi:hypothetical protein
MCRRTVSYIISGDTEVELSYLRVYGVDGCIKTKRVIHKKGFHSVNIIIANPKIIYMTTKLKRLNCSANIYFKNACLEETYPIICTDQSKGTNRCIKEYKFSVNHFISNFKISIIFPDIDP